MMAMKRGWMLVSVLLALLGGCAECAVAQAPLAVTTVQDTVYTASGAAASGTVLVSWPGFTTASGAVVPAGTETVTIGTGGVLSMTLAPNAGATPIGSYYTATFHLGDGSTSREYWVVPVAVAGAPPVKLAAILNDVLPTSVAMQTVSKTYVDMAIAAAVAGHPADSSTPYVLKAGDSMAGPLVLAADPVSANQAADKNYVDENVSAITSGTARLPVFGASGTSHAQGAVPDPGATAGATRYLREDGGWETPPVGGSGTMSTQNANAVAITGGTITGATLGTNAIPANSVTVSATYPVYSYTARQSTSSPGYVVLVPAGSITVDTTFRIEIAETCDAAVAGGFIYIFFNWTDTSGTALTTYPGGPTAPLATPNLSCATLPSNTYYTLDINVKAGNQVLLYYSNGSGVMSDFKIVATNLGS